MSADLFKAFVALSTFLSIGASLLLHVRLVHRLETGGVAVPPWARNLPWVEFKYFTFCRETNVNSWTDLLPLILCAIAGMIGAMYLIAVGGIERITL